MGNIIIALPKLEDAKHISDILRNYGLRTTLVCTSGRAILPKLSDLEHGVVICTHRLKDMHYRRLKEYLPEFCDMILLTKCSELEECPSDVVTLSLPLRATELVNTVEQLFAQQEKNLRKQRPKRRSEEEQKIIGDAKEVLMAKKAMTEEEAFRYIQKSSMNSERNMVETAQMILLLRHDE